MSKLPLLSCSGNLSFERQSYLDSGRLDLIALALLPGSVMRVNHASGVRLQRVRKFLDLFASHSNSLKLFCRE